MAKSAAGTAPGKKAAAPLVTLKGLAHELAEAHEMTKKQAEATLNALVDRVAAHLKAGAKVRLTGIGMLEVKSRPAREGRNPATGAKIQVPASKKVAFRVAKELKEAV